MSIFLLLTLTLLNNGIILSLRPWISEHPTHNDAFGAKNNTAIENDNNYEELTYPPIIGNNNNTTNNKVVNITLSHNYINFSCEVFSIKNARVLNGSIPGPTIVVNAGDTLNIFYTNEMEEQKGIPIGALNTYRYMDETNLHFHGGHVSGDLPSDDIRMKIPPGSSFQYTTKFPSSHMPGTHWIHPHVHGSSALHVSNGAALALIVKDPPNYLPTVIEEANDILMLFQDFDLQRTQNIANEMGDTKFSYGPGSSSNFSKFKATLVNGQFKPYIKTMTNEWMRWRVIYAGHNTQPLNLKIMANNKKCKMILLSKDGIYIQDFPRPISIAPIPTGGRADLMVSCIKAGTYKVHVFDEDALTIQVSGISKSQTKDLPTWTPNYPSYLNNLLDRNATADCTCNTIFEECTSVKENDPFLGCVNDVPFSYKEYVHSIEIGKIIHRNINPDRHSYHQHVYPFQFIRYTQEYQPLIPQYVHEYFKVGDWHDVIQMWGLQGNVEIRFHPREHLGLLMIHCHRLTHEDRGMMSWEWLYDNGDGTCQCDERFGSNNIFSP